jgi:cellulose synthase/poly-beta-1,6-N-acetylglucosamine synthase-like glycosyltransferase
VKTLGVILITLVALVPGWSTVLHLTVMTFGALRYRSDPPSLDVPRHRLLVVVPAHDEELVLGATLDAITADMRRGDRLLVVDDRSTDRTGEIAARAGAVVVTRRPGETPGRAPARQTALEHAARLDWDAIVMIDADSIIEPGFFDACDRMLATGAEALQVRSEASLGRRAVDLAALVSFAVQGVVLPRARDQWGLLVRLRGTGMVLRRSLLARFAFRAPASEDLVYSLDLCRAGVRVRHVDEARLRSQNAGSWRVAADQKVRYEAGRIAAAREAVGDLLRSRSRAGFEAAWFLVSPPIATAATLLVVSTVFGLVWSVTWLAASGFVGLGVLAGGVLLAATTAGIGWRIHVAVAAAPVYLVWKVVVSLRTVLSVARRVDEFGATDRVPVGPDHLADISAERPWRDQG